MSKFVFVLHRKCFPPLFNQSESLGLPPMAATEAQSGPGFSQAGLHSGWEGKQIEPYMVMSDNRATHSVTAPYDLTARQVYLVVHVGDAER